MSLEDNKALALREMEETWNRYNLAAWDELLHPDYSQISPGATPGIEGYKAIVTTFHTAFPDAHYTVRDVIAEGNKVTLRWSVTATHTGNLGNIPATGKAVTADGVLIQEFADGRLLHTWGVFTELQLLQQLGVIPTLS